MYWDPDNASWTEWNKDNFVEGKQERKQVWTGQQATCHCAVACLTLLKLQYIPSNILLLQHDWLFSCFFSFKKKTTTIFYCQDSGRAKSHQFSLDYYDQYGRVCNFWLAYVFSNKNKNELFWISLERTWMWVVK